jgi:hypothetical protein
MNRIGMLFGARKRSNNAERKTSGSGLNFGSATGRDTIMTLTPGH